MASSDYVSPASGQKSQCSSQQHELSALDDVKASLNFDILEDIVVDASPNDGLPLEGKAKKKRALTSVIPCRVCGRIYDDMPSSDKYCWPHKRVVDSMIQAFKSADKKDGTHSLADFTLASNESNKCKTEM